VIAGDKVGNLGVALAFGLSLLAKAPRRTTGFLRGRHQSLRD
jgi:hypothetical protein